MAWNPTPEVTVLRDFSKKYGDDYLILLRINSKNNEYGYVSYGANKSKCDEAHDLAEMLLDYLETIR